MQTTEQREDAQTLKSLAPDPFWDNLTSEQKEVYRQRWQEEDREKTMRLMAQHTSDQLDKRWAEMCPPIYQEAVDLGRITGDRYRAELVMAWKFSPNGMVITGPTGQGKTRTVWHALKRAHYDGYAIKAMDGIAFAHEASAAAYTSNETEKWMTKMTAPDILFIDDLAKRFTPASGPLLFGLVERRVSRRMPIIITTNLTAAQLETLINDPELSKPLVRRLREFCNPIAL